MFKAFKISKVCQKYNLSSLGINPSNMCRPWTTTLSLRVSSMEYFNLNNLFAGLIINMENYIARKPTDLCFLKENQKWYKKKLLKTYKIEHYCEWCKSRQCEKKKKKKSKKNRSWIWIWIRTRDLLYLK